MAANVYAAIGYPYRVRVTVERGGEQRIFTGRRWRDRVTMNGVHGRHANVPAVLDYYRRLGYRIVSCSEG